MACLTASFSSCVKFFLSATFVFVAGFAGSFLSASVRALTVLSAGIVATGLPSDVG